MDFQGIVDLASVATAAKLAEAITGLPAVATLDWCDRAADALTMVCDRCVVSVTLATCDESGSVVNHEATGVAARGLDETEFGREPNAHEHLVGIDDPRLTALRSRTERMSTLGWEPGIEGLTRGVCSTAEKLTGHDGQFNGDLAKLWAGTGAADLLIGLMPLDDAEPGRVIIVQIAPVSHGTRIGRGHVAVLYAVMPLLAKRVLVAVGIQRSSSNQWLTSREQVVLEHLTLGKSVRQIASELGRSPHTVHDHVKALHRKLNASSRGELIARALGHLDHCTRVRDQFHPDNTAPPVAAVFSAPVISASAG